MSFLEVREPLERWVASGRKAGVATLVGVRRSAPRPLGARFAASEAGDVAGSISGGCVESDLFEHIQQVVRAGAPRLVEYGISDEQALEVGLSCGGEIEVLIAPYEPETDVWPALASAIETEHPAILLTGVSEPIRAREMLLPASERAVGTLGAAALDARAADAARPLFEAGGPRTLCLPDANAVVLAEPYLPLPRLAIVGATPVAAALCHLARFVGFSVTVIDPRSAWASAERFPDARRVVARWPEPAFEEIGLDRGWSVVVLAHDPKLDVPALDAALRAGCRYVGQIGGRRTQERRRAALSERGLAETEIARVRGPVGLPIGAETAEEIALSILAELVARRAEARSRVYAGPCTPPPQGGVER